MLPQFDFSQILIIGLIVGLFFDKYLPLILARFGLIKNGKEEKEEKAAKIAELKDKIDTIANNHLHSIETRLTVLENGVSYIKGQLKILMDLMDKKHK